MSDFQGFRFASVEPKDLEKTVAQWNEYVMLLEKDITRLEQNLQVHTDFYHELVTATYDYLASDIATARKTMEDTSDELRALLPRYTWIKAESDICKAYYEIVKRSDERARQEAVKACSHLKTLEEMLEFWTAITK
jgi:hypothetical protein